MSVGEIVETRLSRAAPLRASRGLVICALGEIQVLRNGKPAPLYSVDVGIILAQVPVDAVNTSGSNLDPEISQANAWIQAHRIAAKRRLSLSAVDGLISKYTDARGLGFTGERGVNVLELNLALDRTTGGTG